MKVMSVLMMFVVGVFAIYWLVVFLMFRGLLFPAPGLERVRTAESAPYAIALRVGYNLRESLDSPSVEQYIAVGWLLPPTKPAAEPAPLMIYTHGNAELADDYVDQFSELRNRGFFVLLPEYPGYGAAPGKPSEAHIVRATDALYQDVIDNYAIDADHVFGFGMSLGGGVIARLTRRIPFRAIILQSTFTDVYTLAKRYLVPKFVIRDRFESKAYLKSFKAPALILHGEHDTMIPIKHGQTLHALMPQSDMMSMPCGHNDCGHQWAIMWPFIEQLLTDKQTENIL